jgi:Fe-S cluster assembly iron-binding protein IscA
VQLFNDVTDGATIRQLHHDRYIIDAKIFISSNMTMDISSVSTQRRLIVFEVVNHYGIDYTPEMEFGKRFFEDQWNERDWDKFYSFMIRCALEYLQNGIQRPKEINYSTRRIDEVFYNREDFRYWFEEKIAAAFEGSEIEFAKVEMRSEFVGRYPQYDNPKFTNTFTKWCKEYLQLAEIEYVEIRGTVDLLIINPSDFNKQRAAPKRKVTQNTLNF